jgi:alkanesulfonate monooxygenase SsuD/methylene tetrahydromethanopterin reductase-like flavin-dependent oxidoreductase (luciferase family)
MHFGIFLEERRRGASETATYRETLALADAAEAWGLDCVWLGEVHFNGGRSVQSAPLMLASFMAARTRRLHLGTAVQVLPLNNPLRIAEEVATIDHLSEGRFEFGIGRSGSARSYDILGVPYGESQARFLEALEIIREAWKGRPFSYAGRFFQVNNVAVSPVPYQSPHPPMRMAANSEETFLQVARLGLHIFVGLRDHDVASLRGNLDAYRQAWVEAGHPGRGSAYLRIPVYAAETEREAIEEPRENITGFFHRHLDLVRSGPGPRGHGPRGAAPGGRRAGRVADVRGHPEDARGLRHGAAANRAPRRASGGARPRWDRGRAESGGPALDRADAPDAPHPDPRGHARAQLSGAGRRTRLGEPLDRSV